MLHPVRVPPASGSLPPSDVPSGNTLGSITRAVTSALRPVQLPRQPHLRLVITRILRPPHPARPAGRRFPPPRFRSASPPPGSPPTPRRKEAPRPGLRHRVSCLTPCLRPPRTAVTTRRGLRFGNVVRVVHVARSRGHLRALRRQALSSSLPALPHSCRRLCSLVVPAGTLDPAPCGGKEHLSVLRSQNPAFTGFAKHPQSQGRGITTNPSGAGRSRLGKHGSGRDLQAAWFVASIRHPHQPQPSPALGRSGAGCRKIAHPAPHGPTLDQQRQTAFLWKPLLFKRERTLPSRLPLAVKRL
jgi:hypothetical protein